MLDPNWINNNLDDITVLTADLTTATLTSIAKHVADSLRVQPEKGIMPSTAKQIQSAEAAGLPREDIEQYVAAYLKVAVPEIRKLFTDAGVASITYDSTIYEQAGQEPLKLSPNMQRIIHAGATKAIGDIHRLTGVFTATAAEKMAGVLETIYKRENIAYMQTVSGVESYTSAMNQAMDDLVSDGIKIYSYASGKSISVEAGILRDLRTGISQTAGEITRQGMVERGVSYVDTSAHINARNTGEGFKNHQLWQGLQYYYSQIATEPNTHNLPDFVESTGYGDVAGMKGANCAHDFGPFYPGISTPRHSLKELQEYKDVRYTYTDARGNKRTVDAATARDHQRRLETRVRDVKTRLAVEQAKGDLARPEVIIKLRRDRATANKRIEKFCEETGLKRQNFRERIAQKG